MFPSWSTVSARLAALAAVSIAGCAERTPIIWGTATSQGKPITQGTVLFLPQGETGNVWMLGPLDANGRFRMESSRPEVTLPTGRYGVCINPPSKSDPETGRSVPQEGYPVPAKYLDVTHPVVFVDVKAEQATYHLKFD